MGQYSPARRVLITGANSYIGTAVENWLKKTPDSYQVDTLDMKTSAWRDYDFSGYDVIFHVAGIAHADVGNVTEEQKRLYYQVNTQLAVETARKAKDEGVRQFIFMSSMIVYSGCEEKLITMDTVPKPENFYGDSKWQADQPIRAMSDESFRVVVLRPPMIYGKGSRGNYPLLAKMAGSLPVFPIVKNKRSMLYIENLCQFVKLMIDNEEEGIFFPQNEEYTNTSDMVQMIAQAKRHPLIMLPFTDLPVRLLFRIPGKIGAMAKKAFGDSAYDMEMSEYKEAYCVRTLSESIRLTEAVEPEEETQPGKI
ncbi:MAG: sugar nucleotide-binding protein [Lachnospiraceae bacterium]|nr:sugar nucleotide-binding protein [Lachnospiraceae bacterium]